MFFGVLFGLYVHRFDAQIWHLCAVAFLVLAVVGGLRRWSWLLRLSFQAGWVGCFVMIAINRATR
jgi:hypothetical protein